MVPCGFRAFIVLVLSVLSWITSEACMCMPEHPQQKYCKANFVLNGVILDNANANNNWNITEMVPRSVEKDFITYYVQVERVFKGQNVVDAEQGGVIEIKTPHSSSLCGNVNLQKGRNYLLAGKNENGTLVIDTCDWVVAFRDMTKKQRQSVRYFFKQNCNQCKIIPCFDKQVCKDQSSASSCMYDMTHMLAGFADCEGKHSRCIRSSDGRCRWARSYQMKECLKQRTLMEVNTAF